MTRQKIELKVHFSNELYSNGDPFVLNKPFSFVLALLDDRVAYSGVS